MAFIFKREKLLLQADEFINYNTQNILDDIKTLVDIPSVSGVPQKNAPFGKEVDKALKAALDMAQKAGLKTANVDGYFGFADLVGESEKQIATVAHLDVVPQGNGWDFSPFDMTVKDGFIIGRGVVDNKGPAVLTLYIAKFFSEYYGKLPYTLRLMFGTDEESGMRGIKYYLEKYNYPEFCFTPDSNFPVGYAEKGLYGGVFESKQLNGAIKSFKGGVATNVVPDSAVATVCAYYEQLPIQENIELTKLDNGDILITATGKGGHASMPEGTVNAIGVLANYLLLCNICSAEEKEFLNFLSVLHSDTSGGNYKINAQDDIFTPLTCVGGTIDFINNKLVQTIDIRYPTSITRDELFEKLSAFSTKYCATHTCTSYKQPFVTGADTPMVKVLSSAYSTVMGEDKKPYSMGGGTYARCFKSAVSFGIEEPCEQTPSWVGTIHGANEGVSIELLKKSLKIFILGVAELMNLEF